MKPAKKKRANAGTSKASAKERRLAFANAYITNGQNGLQAAITAGFSAKTAGSKANQLLKEIEVRAIIDEANKKASELAGLSVERTLLEIARLAYADPRKLYDQDGNLIPIHMLDDDTAATIASVEIDETFSGKGDERIISGYLRKIKQHGKTQALDMAMKHLKLYSEDAPAGTTIINKIYYGTKPKDKAP